MRKVAIVVLASAAASAAVATAASSRAPAVAVPHVAAKPAKGEGALLAVVPGARGPVLGRADKRAAWIARRSPRLRIFNPVSAWAYSADGTQLVLGTSSRDGSGPVSSAQFVAPASLTRVARTKLGSGDVAAMEWSSERINLVLRGWCCPGSFDVIGLSAQTHRAVSRRHFDWSVVDVRRAGATLVVLTSPAAGIGFASLVVIGGDGAVRTVALDEVAAGMELPDENAPSPLLRQNLPGLAVDPDGARVFVVSGTGPVAQVSLSTLAVSYHDVAAPVSLLGRVHEWLEPAAAAKGVNGPVRIATYLGSGVLAVTGADETASVDADNQMHFTRTPVGLRLLDTNTWESKLIDAGADSVTVDGGRLLATGSRWSNEEAQTGIGLAVYGFDGARRLAALGGSPVSVELSLRGRAYLTVPGSATMQVVDLTSGAVTERRAPVAQLLTR